MTAFALAPNSSTHRPAEDHAGVDPGLQAGGSTIAAVRPGARVQSQTRGYHAIVADGSLSYDERFLELVERREELAAREDRTPSVAAEILQIDDIVIPKLVAEWRLRRRRAAEDRETRLGENS